MFPLVMAWYLLPARWTINEQSWSCGPVTRASHTPSDSEVGKSTLTMYILLGVVRYMRSPFVILCALTTSPTS